MSALASWRATSPTSRARCYLWLVACGERERGTIAASAGPSSKVKGPCPCLGGYGLVPLRGQNATRHEAGRLSLSGAGARPVAGFRG
eukprot:scaffold81436_cov23-Tisochrysis_lutea.AAC.3